MNLDAVPRDAALLIDANVLIYAVQHVSSQCRRLLLRCESGEVSGAITAIALGEFCHRRMMQEAQSLGLAGSNPARTLGQNAGLVRSLSRYRYEIQDLMAGRMKIHSLEMTDFASALDLQKDYGLLTNDSLHLAVGLRVGLTMLASNDSHFDVVPNITVFKPDDLG